MIKKSITERERSLKQTWVVRDCKYFGTLNIASNTMFLSQKK